MPSKSKSQQRFFGMVDAYKKGELKNASSKIKKAAKGMSMDDVKDFAETKHKGLPEKVEEKVIRLTEDDLHRVVKESVDRILKESYDIVEPYCFETDREEQWYQVGYNQGLDYAIEWLKDHINDYLVKGRDIDLMFDDLRNSV